jgi:hypothetical protein
MKAIFYFETLDVVRITQRALHSHDTARTWDLMYQNKSQSSVPLSVFHTLYIIVWTQFPFYIVMLDPLIGNVSVNNISWEPTRARIGRILLGNGSVNTPKTIRVNRRRCFLWGPPRGYITTSSNGADFAAGYHLLKLQRLQNKVLRTTGNFPRRTSVRDLYMALKFLHIYDYITNLCRQQAEVIQNHENANVRNIGQGERRQRKYKRLRLGSGQAYDR